MPVLASSLKGSNPRLHIQALTALTAGLKHTPELVTSYLSDILPDCLTLATAGAVMVTAQFSSLMDWVTRGQGVTVLFVNPTPPPTGLLTPSSVL